MNPTTKMRAFPVQIIDLDDGVLLVRGSSQVKIGGHKVAAEAVKLILTACSGEGSSLEEILDLFSPPERPAVEKLIEQLVDRLILAEGNTPPPPNNRIETELEVFYWNFGLAAEKVEAELNKNNFVIVGINTINRRLCQVLEDTGVNSYEVIDYNQLRNLRLFKSDGTLKGEKWPAPIKKPVGSEKWLENMDPGFISCLIATSDFGGQHILRDWNTYCVENNILFLPVVLNKSIGYIGPLTVPGETACFECLRGRENSNFENPELERISEYHAYSGQLVAGFHPSMASILGDFAVMELTKFFSHELPWRVGELIEVNLLAPSLTTRKVLKLPRCQTCGPLTKVPSISPLKQSFIPENYQDYVDDE